MTSPDIGENNRQHALSPEQDLAILMQYLATNSHMNTANKHRPSVPSGCVATDQGGGQTCDAAEGAKIIWIWTAHHMKLNLTTFNARILCSEASLAVLLEELPDIHLDVIGICEVRRLGEGYTLSKDGRVVSHYGLADKRKLGV